MTMVKNYQAGRQNYSWIVRNGAVCCLAVGETSPEGSCTAIAFCTAQLPDSSRMMRTASLLAKA